MARVNEKGYVDRKVVRNVYRDWWLIKNSGSMAGGVIDMTRITLPQEYVGKKVRIKVELL